MTGNKLCFNDTQDFFDDRHADEPMFEFISMTRDLVIDGLDLSAPLRYPFYVNCIRTDNYKSTARYFILRLLSVASVRINITGGGWIFVREGNSQREKDITVPVNEAIQKAGMKAGWAFIDDNSKFKRLLLGLYHLFLTTDVLHFFIMYSRKVTTIADRLINRFNLDKSFTKWFIISVLSHYLLYKEALKKIGKKRNIINGFIVWMECHRMNNALLQAAKTFNLPVILTQHGFLGQEWLHFPVQSDRICVWGEVEKDWYKERGIGEDRIRITGTHLAFPIKPEDRLRMREQFNIEAGQYVIFYLIPNALDYFHEKSVKLLDQLHRSLSDENCRWFIRPHRINKPHVIGKYTALGFESFPGDAPVEDAFALADVVIHDYSTLATAEYSGLVTLCLPADPPYPEFYTKLLGSQPLINSPGQFVKIVKQIQPGYEPNAKATPAMAAGGEEALRNICKVVEELTV